MLSAVRWRSRRRNKIFGLGLSKTGTTTLATCLRELGYRHSGYNPALLVDWSTGRLDRIFDVIKRHDCFEDWPYPLLFRDLMTRYGDGAYYVLTVRKDAATWLESLKQHAMRGHPDNARFRKIAYGYDYPQLAEAAHLAFYERHNAAVLAYAEELGIRDRVRVLCWERGDGWPELCDFLSVQCPGTAFPHANSAASMPPDPEIQATNQSILQAFQPGSRAPD